MKKWIITFGIVVVIPLRASAMAPLKLPYPKGQSFVVTQGYNAPPTHIKKDAYAIDFTKNGCDAYGNIVVAAAAGTAMFISQEGYNGGYGTELIINHGNNIVSRYAHMIPGSITLSQNGAVVHQGQAIGRVGDTGLVAGLACETHPGTHLHFAMDRVTSDGTFSAYLPEPISGYMGITEGKWYVSDNDEENDLGDATFSPTVAGDVLGASTSVIAVPSTTTVAVATTAVVATAPSSSPVVPQESAPPVGAVSIMSGGGNSVGPSSIVGGTSDGGVTDVPPASPDAPPAVATTGILFAQSDDSTSSLFSWYDDNWFQLGSGFSGTLNTLTLEGKVSNQDYFASHVSLQEFKDKEYTAMVQQFPISDNAPFTPAMATATFTGLSIQLKPYFYYRLATIQDYQNRSVILAGTATTTVGVAMSDAFYYGTGRVESTSTFFPFLVMEGIFASSTFTPPPITAPSAIVESFDPFGMQLAVSWATSTDPDWPSNPLQYQMNYSTSTTLSDDGWGIPGSIPVTFGNTYLIGVRAKDNFGDVSAVATTTWNFPAGFIPYLLSPGLGYAYQYFTVPSTSTLQSIQLFTTDLETSARYTSSVSCSLQLFDEYNLSSLGVTQSDNGFGGYDCTGAPIFSFASSSLVLYPDHEYHWIFRAQTGNPSTSAGVRFYGMATDTAGGLFSDPSLVNAKFIVTGDTGVLFSN